jgi:hypothetical protein
VLAGAATHALAIASISLGSEAQTPVVNPDINSEYFEGRWAFAEETCDVPTNWTLLAGGNFISDDLTGTWEWTEGRLVLRLTDLAVDEETGEVGGRFQMEGPVEISSDAQYRFTIAPDVYVMKRCP